MILEVTVNGELHQKVVEPRITLLEFLRQILHLTGTKEGCGLGDCGTCIVLVDGKPVNSCLMLAIDAKGHQVTTIEGLSKEGVLDPVQKAFVEKGAVQCGFCTPAMILSAKALFAQNPDPEEEDIKQALSGVLCRCGSYKKILEAIKSVKKKAC